VMRASNDEYVTDLLTVTVSRRLEVD
jgi:hypothetical protein